MKKAICSIVLVLSVFVAVYVYYYYRWQHLWEIEPTHASYPIREAGKDTLRVVMIGDSWAALHSDMQMDSFLQKRLQEHSSKPVVVKSQGHGGEKSKGIYQLMFQSEGYGTKPLLQSGAHYCILSAGINDAAANLGTKQYCAHYLKIQNFLLEHGIRPVVFEIPDVDIKGLYSQKNKKDLLADYVKSVMTHCDRYDFSNYRKALSSMLDEMNVRDKVLYIPLKEWYGDSAEMNRALFMQDGIHLNRAGYEKLDVGIATAILRDLGE